MAIKRYIASKDNTITNAYRSSLLNTQRGTGSNMGMADVVEIFSIYGEASGSDGLSEELSRAIIQFPVDSISSDRTSNLIPASGSVSFYLKMFNARHVYTLPRNFNLVVQAISSSWEEGTGLDMEEYKDVTYNNSGSNWIQARMSSSGGTDNGQWATPGGDYLLANTYHQYNVSFPEGHEDLEVDISGLVEDWIAGTFTNNGMGVYLTASQETYFSSSTGGNTGSQDSIIQNTSGSTESYYTKKFFARSSEYFFKRPVIEARWDSRTKDDRGSFYYSSSLAPGADNLNTLYLYNYVRGQLKDIPIVSTGNILISLYSGSTAPTASKLVLYDGNTNITGGWVSTGLYTASMALTAAATLPLTLLFDVWHSSSTEYFTSSINPLFYNGFNNAPTEEYVFDVSNLKPQYTRKETARLRLFIRDKDWSPNIYTVATADVINTTLPSASYKVFRLVDDMEVVAYGTGSDRSTYMSYDVSGNYFDLDMSMLQADYGYGIKFSYYNNSINDWLEQPEIFKFRVEEK